jgi:hypothetical protein
LLGSTITVGHSRPMAGEKAKGQCRIADCHDWLDTARKLEFIVHGDLCVRRSLGRWWESHALHLYGEES